MLFSNVCHVRHVCPEHLGISFPAMKQAACFHTVRPISRVLFMTCPHRIQIHCWLPRWMGGVIFYWLLLPNSSTGYSFPKYVFSLHYEELRRTPGSLMQFPHKILWSFSFLGHVCVLISLCLHAYARNASH